MYFEATDAGDERSRVLASVASESVSKYSGDKFETVASAFYQLRISEDSILAKKWLRISKESGLKIPVAVIQQSNYTLWKLSI